MTILDPWLVQTEGRRKRGQEMDRKTEKLAREEIGTHSTIKSKCTGVSVISTNVFCVHKSWRRDGHRKLLSFDIQIIFK